MGEQIGGPGMGVGMGVGMGEQIGGPGMGVGIGYGREQCGMQAALFWLTLRG